VGIATAIIVGVVLLSHGIDTLVFGPRNQEVASSPAPTAPSAEVAELKREIAELKRQLEGKTAPTRPSVDTEAEARGKSANTSIRTVIGRAADVTAVVAAAGDLAKKKSPDEVAIVEMSVGQKETPPSVVKSQKESQKETDLLNQIQEMEERLRAREEGLRVCTRIAREAIDDSIRRQAEYDKRFEESRVAKIKLQLQSMREELAATK